MMLWSRKRRRNTTYSAQLKRRSRTLRFAALASIVSCVAVIVIYLEFRSRLVQASESPIETSRLSSDSIALTTVEEVLNQIDSAGTVTLSAFSLSASSEVVAHLEAASDRGAKVSVALDRGFGFYVRENRETSETLEAHGVRVHVVGDGHRSIHLKAAVLDGRLFLSDRNWPTRQRGKVIVIRDDIAGDRVVVERAILGDAASNDHLWTLKADALVAEAEMLEDHQSPAVRVSTESFGAGTPVYQALADRADRGDDVKLLVSTSELRRSLSEKASIRALIKLGVHVRAITDDEKMALDGAAVWIGSANATRGVPNQIEFGLRQKDDRLAVRLAAQFDAEWMEAKPIEMAQ